MNIFSSPSGTQMYDEQSFYRAFEKDLYSARKSVIIESPFITQRRIEELLPVIVKYHYTLKSTDRTFTSRTASLYVPSKPVKVVSPIGKRQGALHLDRFAMRHRVLTPLRKVKEK